MDKKARPVANQDLQVELSGCQREVEVLRSELELSTAILNALNAIALVFDPKGHIVRCNSYFKQITGYTLNEVKNQPFWDLFCNQDERESAKAVFEKIQQDLTVKALLNKLIAHAHNWITKDGSSHIAWDYTPCLDSDGAVKYVIGIGNITSKTQAKLVNQERVAQLEEQNRLLSARDRILEATTSTVNTLLTTDNLEFVQALTKEAGGGEQEKAAQKQAAELSEINKVLQAEVARKRAEQVSRGQTEALVKTLTVLAAEPVLDNFLGYVLQAIAQQLGDSGGIWLYDEAYDTTILHIDYEDGQIRRGAEISRPGASRQNVLRQWDADYMQLLQEKKVLIQNVQDLPQTPVYAQSRAYNQQRGIKTILVVCLFFGEKFLGNITLRSTKQRDYKPEELDLACVLAYQASLAIQLTRLAEQAQQSAVLKERNRIAREIHDTLAQVLTGIVVQLQAAEDVHTTEPSDRQAHIATARQLAKQGLTEARRSVRALRPQALEGNDLTGALANIIEQMGMGTALQTVCRVQGTPYFLSPDVESNLLRIAQEAFTNILKHAGASESQIELVYDPGQVRLRVLDNGQGFNPNLTVTESYGLIGMRERTQSIGAELTITSQPGEGTEVLVVVPILSPGQRSLL